MSAALDTGGADLKCRPAMAAVGAVSAALGFSPFFAGPGVFDLGVRIPATTADHGRGFVKTTNSISSIVSPQGLSASSSS